MTHYIAHRRNSIEQLVNTESCFGIEVDIRSYEDNLIINHDPFIKGELFLNWINYYNHGTLILNVKEEGLEEKLIQIMKKKKITNYFFLDQSFPFLIKWANLGEKNAAVRVSEYETIETALNLSGKINWVWLDCFHNFPLEKKSIELLKDNHFKICMVSPELQGREPLKYIPKYFKILNDNQIKVDAVCTKNPHIWIDLEKQHA